VAELLLGRKKRQKRREKAVKMGIFLSLGTKRKKGKDQCKLMLVNFCSLNSSERKFCGLFVYSIRDHREFALIL
jgi:hypothetical protein